MREHFRFQYETHGERVTVRVFAGAVGAAPELAGAMTLRRKEWLTFAHVFGEGAAAVTLNPPVVEFVRVDAAAPTPKPGAVQPLFEEILDDWRRCPRMNASAARAAAGDTQDEGAEHGVRGV